VLKPILMSVCALVSQIWEAVGNIFSCKSTQTALAGSGKSVFGAAVLPQRPKVVDENKPVAAALNRWPPPKSLATPAFSAACSGRIGEYQYLRWVGPAEQNDCLGVAKCNMPLGIEKEGLSQGAGRRHQERLDSRPIKNVLPAGLEVHRGLKLT